MRVSILSFAHLIAFSHGASSLSASYDATSSAMSMSLSARNARPTSLASSKRCARRLSLLTQFRTEDHKGIEDGSHIVASERPRLRPKRIFSMSSSVRSVGRVAGCCDVLVISRN